jgi:hypothetical protein
MRTNLFLPILMSFIYIYITVMTLKKTPLLIYVLHCITELVVVHFRMAMVCKIQIIGIKSSLFSIVETTRCINCFVFITHQCSFILSDTSRIKV